MNDLRSGEYRKQLWNLSELLRRYSEDALALYDELAYADEMSDIDLFSMLKNKDKHYSDRGINVDLSKVRV